MIPQQGIDFGLFHPTSNKALCGAQGKDKVSIPVSLVLQCQKVDPRRYQVIQSDRDVHVCGYGGEK